ncbi:MAG: hypothetical protein C0617_02040 [Desulfuromonas sp.]|uniref:SseB family protein n=1 Tax=Desulfuromonas sp. TaxID=892 RepID=UPI000CB75F1F|nr:SseB family protein [Desulfuromonas sp.]PLX86163.1 MAG: hypothetical protein C0617_02040 [Desulfuromonas sp.]
MTEIDKALETLRTNTEDTNAQFAFYNLFLNTIFFVPTMRQSVVAEEGSGEKEIDLPLIVQTDDTDFLVFFDLQERLNDWAEKEAPCVQLPGHALADLTNEGLYWAMNIGTDQPKEFTPEEITWLKDVVARCKADTEACGE